MNEHFSNIKKAFYQNLPQMNLADKFNLRSPNRSFSYTEIHYSKWVKLFSIGIIFYSGYHYLKRTTTIQQCSFFSYFYQMKKLFSKRIENDSKKNSISLEVTELPEHVKYDSGWYVELDELKQTLTSASASVPEHAGFNNSLRENTPRGDIIMHYDADKKSFNYYSNSKNIPYSTLDAVARKYVCLHKDPSIYIDIRDEIQKGREKRMKKDKDEKMKLERNANITNKNGILSSAKKSLFAVFKNYKTGQKSVSVPVPKTIHDSRGNAKVKVEESVMVIKDRINKFIYKGTLEQYESDLKSYKTQQQSNKKHVYSESDPDLNAVSEHTEHTEHTENKNSLGGNHTSSGRADSDYIRLNHEKEDLSYSEFKKKYNP